MKFISREYKDKYGHWHSKYECQCGAVSICREYRIESGKTKSCGCSKQGNRNAEKHGQCHSITYISWMSLMQRCYYVKHKSYADYGGKGIITDSKWRTYEGFVEDVGERPSSDHCFSRIDHDKGYTLGNVVWELKSENSRESMVRNKVSRWKEKVND